MSLVDLKKRFWREYQTLPDSFRSGPVFLALSGGKDSTVLAHVALSLRDKLPPLHFLHVNYHLRLPDSDQEELFLRRWAARENVPFHVKRLHPKVKPKNLQDWARRQRYQFFRRVLLEKGKGEGILCLAHHRDDQVETILMRLMTGSGLKALGGMRSLEKNGSGVFCFRPFLTVPSSAILTYIHSHGLTFCHDKSNDESDYFRNRLRLQVLPRLEEENPQAAEALIRLGRKARGAQEALEQLAQDWLARHGSQTQKKEWPRRPLNLLPPALRLTVLEQLLRGHVKETRNLGRILEAVDQSLMRPRSQQEFLLPEGRVLKLSAGAIRIQGVKASLRSTGVGRGRKTQSKQKP